MSLARPAAAGELNHWAITKRRMYEKSRFFIIFYFPFYWMLKYNSN